MTISDNLSKFHGFDVIDFESGDMTVDPTRTAVRIKMGFEGESEDFADLWAEFINSPGVEQTQALVIGTWYSPDDPSPSDPAVALIVSDAERLPKLRALFFGDITMEESEISWIQQSDVSAFWGAFPNLEVFGIRGGTNLQLGAIRHARLKSLVVEAGGLPRTVVQEIAQADLPALEHLEIWLGTENYGGDSGPDDLAPILDGGRFPKLTSLALRDCEWADQLAAAVARAPILDRIKRLDLSLGTLGDAGIDALVASPAVRRLQHLDIHHHYASEAGVAKLKALGISVNVDERIEPDGNDPNFRYVAVSE
jgi:hypothetical protein